MVIRSQRIVTIRGYFQASEIGYIDSDCGCIKDVWATINPGLFGTGSSGYIDRATIAKLIFPDKQLEAYEATA